MEIPEVEEFIRVEYHSPTMGASVLRGQVVNVDEGEEGVGIQTDDGVFYENVPSVEIKTPTTDRSFWLYLVEENPDANMLIRNSEWSGSTVLGERATWRYME